MKKFGRVICLTALVLALGLTGCDKDDKKDSKETTTAAAEATVDTTEASTDATEDKSEEKSEEKTEEKSEEKTEEKSEEASAESVILVGKDGNFKEIKVDISSELSVEELEDFELVQSKVVDWIGESIKIVPKLDIIYYIRFIFCI